MLRLYNLHLVMKTETEQADIRIGPFDLMVRGKVAQIRFVTHFTILTVSYLRVAVRPL